MGLSITYTTTPKPGVYYDPVHLQTSAGIQVIPVIVTNPRIHTIPVDVIEQAVNKFITENKITRNEPGTLPKPGEFDRNSVVVIQLDYVEDDSNPHQHDETVDLFTIRVKSLVKDGWNSITEETARKYWSRVKPENHNTRHLLAVLLVASAWLRPEWHEMHTAIAHKLAERVLDTLLSVNKKHVMQDRSNRKLAWLTPERWLTTLCDLIDDLEDEIEEHYRITGQTQSEITTSITGPTGPLKPFVATDRQPILPSFKHRLW